MRDGTKLVPNSVLNWFLIFFGYLIYLISWSINNKEQ